MDIISKILGIEVSQPTDSEQIEKILKEKGITPLRWAIVKVQENKVTVNVTYENIKNT